MYKERETNLHTHTKQEIKIRLHIRIFPFSGFEIRQCSQNLLAPYHSRLLKTDVWKRLFVHNPQLCTFMTFLKQQRRQTCTTAVTVSRESHERKPIQQRSWLTCKVILSVRSRSPLENWQRPTSCVMETTAGWTASAGNGHMQHSARQAHTLAVSIYAYLYHGSHKTTACKHARSPHTKCTTSQVPPTRCTLTRVHGELN
jgi:hypothetical protein